MPSLPASPFSRALATGLIVLSHSPCDGHAPPPSRSPLAATSTPAPARGREPQPMASASLDRATAAPSQITPRVGCDGADVDLAAALASEDCYVLATTVGAAEPKLPAGIEVELVSTPARLRNREHATATLTIRNTGAEREEVHFHPLGSNVSVLLDLVDPRTLDRHRDGGTGYPVPPGAARLARITLAPGGIARLTIPWTALRTTGGHPPPRARPDSVPLLPGTYQLTAWTGLPGLSPKDPEQTRAPAALITIVP